MSQSSLDDDELFGEAASEMRADVEESLDAVRSELPDADDVWETDADNVLGVLNGLRSALDTGDAEEELRDAKKWFTMGQRADAFDDAEDLEEAIEELDELLAGMEDAAEQVGDLTATVPELRGTLQDAEAAADGDSDAADEDADDEGADDAEDEEDEE
ncbi:hypothetical protein G9464_11855 [Halostella sp. JP-L12]|uniref:DUF5790 family protein n=1 Tax=Halostella TaxID=1843185 RepID=UPI000EF7A623|nr:MULTISPECIES: DUF5790 family protein [Halostella]NHN48289.1 hypothetical protein [Halostella sp. JP-L12]